MDKMIGRTALSETKLKGVLKIKRYRSDDHRGFYAEIYIKEVYQKLGITADLTKEVVHSFSRKRTLRGLHGDNKTWKLVSCPFGELYLVVLNYDQNSDQFGQWESFTLTPKNRLQILVPPRFANGHLVISEWAMFHYCQSEYYTSANNQFVVSWKDPRFNIVWPLKPGQKPLMSPRDQEAK